MGQHYVAKLLYFQSLHIHRKHLRGSIEQQIRQNLVEDRAVRLGPMVLYNPVTVCHHLCICS